jgi:uncharacterized protein YkwD
MEKPKKRTETKPYKIGVCVECKVRDGDSSKKKLYQCPYCGRWFCEKHIEPRIATTRGAIEQIRDPVLRDKVLEEWRKPDGHPDTVWTKKYFEDLKKQQEEERKKFWEALEDLNKIKETKIQKRSEIKETLPGSSYTFIKEEQWKPKKEKVREERKTIPIPIILFILIILLIIAIEFINSENITNKKIEILNDLNNLTSWIQTSVNKILESVNYDPIKELNEKVNSIDIRMLELKLFERINQERIKYGLPPLKWNEELSEVARAHSIEMAENNYFAHEGLDCKKVDYRVSKKGIFYTIVGENLLQISLINNYLYDPKTLEIRKREYRTLDELVEESVKSWMDSPGHRKNILNKDFDETGIGIAIQNVPKVYMEEKIRPSIEIVNPIDWSTCPVPSNPDKEATFYITQVFISTRCPIGTTLCNNKCYENCPPGYIFVCRESGALCLR